MTTRKKRVAILLGAVMILLLSGCSSRWRELNLTTSELDTIKEVKDSLLTAIVEKDESYFQSALSQEALDTPDIDEGIEYMHELLSKSEIESIEDGPTPITELIRNNILSIDATANSSGWELKCNVKPWDVEDVTIDFKDNLSYSSAGWMEGTYLEQGSDLENNLIHLSPTVPAELKFTIQAPNSATWRAQLTGDVNDIQIVEGFTSGVAYSDGNPVEQTIKVQVTNPDLEDRQPEVILHVFADIAGNTYELDLTDPNKVMNPGEETDPINRFTLIQAQ